MLVVEGRNFCRPAQMPIPLHPLRNPPRKYQVYKVAILYVYLHYNPQPWIQLDISATTVYVRVIRKNISEEMTDWRKRRTLIYMHKIKAYCKYILLLGIWSSLSRARAWEIHKLTNVLHKNPKKQDVYSSRLQWDEMSSEKGKCGRTSRTCRVVPFGTNWMVTLLCEKWRRIQVGG